MRFKNILLCISCILLVSCYNKIDIRNLIQEKYPSGEIHYIKNNDYIVIDSNKIYFIEAYGVPFPKLHCTILKTK